MQSQEYESHKDLKAIQETFDAIAAEFDITRYKPWPQTVEFIEDLPDNSTILDLGCGNGRNTKYLASTNRGFTIIGLDFSKPMLRITKNKLEQLNLARNVKLLLGDVINLPLASSSIDAVIYVAALHHLPGANLRLASLQELERVLRLGGKAFISVWDFEQERFSEELKKQLEESPEDGEFGDVYVPWTGKRGSGQQRFYHLFYGDEFEKLLGQTGLKVEKLFRAADNYHAVVGKAGNIENLVSNKGLKTPFDIILDACKTKLKLTELDLKLLPTKWELLGDVLVLKLDEDLKDHWGEIAKIYAKILKAKAVLRRTDKIRGTYREPGVELLFGEDRETIHTENKVKFRFDAMKVMFSSGNIDERIRISTMARHYETIADMFAGIGYFSLPLAVHSRPKKIIACELNPVAYEYLVQNINLNQMNHIIEPILGDNRKSIPAGIAERIIMGYLKSMHSHRVAAFKILKPNGGILHFHDVGFSDKVVDSAFEKIKKSLKNSEFKNKFDAEVFNYYKIKSYGPKLVHVVLDITIKPI